MIMGGSEFRFVTINSVSKPHQILQMNRLNVEGNK